jgi:hypothetical protein
MNKRAVGKRFIRTDAYIPRVHVDTKFQVFKEPARLVVVAEADIYR